MQNGGMEQLMNNPLLRQMADQYSQSGQMPDIGSLMNNPQMRQYVCARTAAALTPRMAQQMMGNFRGQR